MVGMSSSSSPRWRKKQSSSSSRLFSPVSFLTHFLVAIMAFHAGLLAGYQTQPSTTTTTTATTATNAEPCSVVTEMSATSARHVQEEKKKKQLSSSSSSSSPESSFQMPSTVSSFAVGMGRVPRDDFAAQIQVGVPLDKTTSGNEEVMILYGAHSQPTATTSDSNDGSSIPFYRNVTQATANCNSLKVILTQPNVEHDCLAVMGQWESHHVHKFLRIPQENKAKPFRNRKKVVSPNHPLRYVSRTTKEDGLAIGIPHTKQQEQYYKLLTEYLTSLESSLERLKPIAKKVATTAAKDGKTTTTRPIVVLVCNFGQSELLMNFVCSARARGLDISQVLLFATDAETTQLAKSLGLAVFEVKDAFGVLPKGSAKRYGDAIFSGMMMSKVYCVHMISSLGYDLLFQDVDVVWYKNPVWYFENKTASGDFDFYFQDDGAHSPRYRPYSPNSGFYFVRNNERTQYFFSVFARMGDLIQQSGSHQSAMNALLADHASWRGLRIKVFGRETDEVNLFPGGFQYHKRPYFMKQLVQGELDGHDNDTISPYIFHMSWTENKNNKVKFFQQLGDWYTQDVCIQQADAATAIQGGEEDGDTKAFLSKCCSAEPIIVCHYKDKPSKHPCKDSPNIDKRGRPFW